MTVSLSNILLFPAQRAPDAATSRARYNRGVTQFALSFLLVFGELAFGGMFALAIPPFFKIERGFYKSTASVYLSFALLTAIGIGLLAWRATATIIPGPASLWIACGIWVAFCALFAVYLFTLWTDNGLLRARLFSAAMVVGLVAVIASVMLLKPANFGAAAIAAYAITAITSSLVLGLVSGAMMFGHWYLIDLSMPVDYLKNFVRLLGFALIADLAAIGFAMLLMGFFAGPAPARQIVNLFHSHLALFAFRVVLGPVATLVLAWMCWQTLKIPQTMAATGLLYIALMSVVVGEMLGRFILFRTALPL